MICFTMYGIVYFLGVGLWLLIDARSRSCRAGRRSRRRMKTVLADVSGSGFQYRAKSPGDGILSGIHWWRSE